MFNMKVLLIDAIGRMIKVGSEQDKIFGNGAEVFDAMFIEVMIVQNDKADIPMMIRQIPFICPDLCLDSASIE
jgi:hypothetical protein